MCLIFGKTKPSFNYREVARWFPVSMNIFESFVSLYGPPHGENYFCESE